MNRATLVVTFLVSVGCAGQTTAPSQQERGRSTPSSQALQSEAEPAECCACPPAEPAEPPPPPTGEVQELSVGSWKNISPRPESFRGDPGSGSFGQGIAIDPRNPNVLYFSLCHFDPAQGGLFKSTDRGTTWNRIGPMDAPLVARIDPRDTRHLFVGSGVRGSTMGLWESKDAGATWAKLATFNAGGRFIDDIYEIAVDPANFDHMLVSSHSPWDWGNVPAGAGIVETRDGGKTWIAHDPQGSWGMGHGIWFLGNSATWLLGTQDNGYWRTTNSGQTWTKVSEVNMAHGGGQVYRASNGAWYVSSARGTLRSTDGGASFKEVGSASFTTAVFGDGQRLYTAQAYAGAPGPFSVSGENDGTNWAPQPGGQSFKNGPDEFAFDPVNSILYSSNWGDGLLAMKTR
jgi:photosystem II stability/assembly factor-like uncharacterized protein